MGTDIHVVFQKKVGDSWQDIPHDYDENRHYYLFAWLANVRNGFGFAGVLTGSPIKPISMPRGFPQDFKVEDERHPTDLDKIAKWHLKYMDEDEKKNPSVWMGYHSQSWLFLEEIIKAPKPVTWKTGVISKDYFYEWDGKSKPEAYSGAITGHDIFVAPNPCSFDDKTTHVQVFWKENGDELDYFVELVQNLYNEHGSNTRMVFGFDS